MLLLSGESGLSRMVVIVLVIVAVVAVAAGVPMFLDEQKTSLKLSVTTDVRETTNAVETALRKVDQDESKITFAGGYDCVKEGDKRYCTFSKDQPGTLGGVAVSVSKGNTVKVTFYLKLGIYEVAPEDFAVAEFVDSSKLELQHIVRQGLDMLRKENA